MVIADAIEIIEIEAWERMGYRWSYGKASQVRAMLETAHQLSGHTLRTTYWDSRCNDCEFKLVLMGWHWSKFLSTETRYALSFDNSLIIDPE
jgi:hypothetical protein|tara:strand:+ start:242 stop:517 length:276 start_codon:yes stop_codon:yes gene_type:complete